MRTLDFTVEAQIASGLLQPVLEDWNEGAWWPVSVVYPQHRQPTAKIRAFIDFVAGLLPQPETAATQPYRDGHDRNERPRPDSAAHAAQA